MKQNMRKCICALSLLKVKKQIRFLSNQTSIKLIEISLKVYFQQNNFYYGKAEAASEGTPDKNYS